MSLKTWLDGMMEDGENPNQYCYLAVNLHDNSTLVSLCR